MTARHIAQRAGAPAGPRHRRAGRRRRTRSIAFAQEHGLPVAIKAAFGGGGRGLKVARTMEEIPALFESATREAVAAFGRGECFVERYLDQPRHVEAQVLADQHGNVIVVGTRDCSLQRRHQKLVEEAPAPFLTAAAARRRSTTSAKAICREAGYHGAGTVEYLVGSDGTISFLEVNTRLQVEHPVTEETSGIDLVREQFRIADGEKLRFTADPAPRGHAIEFRINGEDPGRGFLPAPGHGHRAACCPAGPGRPGGHRHRVRRGHRRQLRLAAGQGDHHRRDPAPRRWSGPAGRWTRWSSTGMATALPFHRLVVRDPSFVDEPFRVHTRWIETEWDNTVAAVRRRRRAGRTAGRSATTVVVEVGGKRLEVSPPGRPRRRHAAAAPGRERRPAEAAARASRSRRGRVGRRADQPDAGHHRQGRGGRRGHRGRGRPGRRAGGDEDGAAAATRTRPAWSPA